LPPQKNLWLWSKHTGDHSLESSCTFWWFFDSCIFREKFFFKYFPQKTCILNELRRHLSDWYWCCLTFLINPFSSTHFYRIPQELISIMKIINL
jgi:hypothetical protein